jgi:hypothetical protein
MSNEMNQKKMFIVKLADFLVANKMYMSGYNARFSLRICVI